MAPAFDGPEEASLVPGAGVPRLRTGPACQASARVAAAAVAIAGVATLVLRAAVAAFVDVPRATIGAVP